MIYQFKKTVWPILLIGAFLGSIGLQFIRHNTGTAATLTAGYTFTTNEQVTNIKLGNLVNNATISGIVAADISAGAVGNSQLAANAVDNTKILAATITGASIANATLTAGLYGTNSIGGVAMATNSFFPSGTYNFTNANTILNYTNATLLFTANQIPSGSVSNAVSSNIGITKALFQTNLPSSVTLGLKGVYTNIFTYVTTLGSNTMISAVATFPNDAANNSIMCRIRADGLTVTNFSFAPNQGSTFGGQPNFLDAILVSNVTVYVDFAGGNADSSILNNGLTINGAGGQTITNLTKMIVKEWR